MTLYEAITNVPGYLPMDDARHVFGSATEAWEWLVVERTRDLDDPIHDEDDSDEDYALDEMTGYVADGGTGTVQGRTPGSDSGYDLGIAYTVRIHDCDSYCDHPDVSDDL